MRGYMIVCILAVAVLCAADYPVVAESGDASSESAALAQTPMPVTKQPPVLHIRPAQLLAVGTPMPDQRPCYYLGVVAPADIDKGIMLPHPIPTPQYEPQKSSSIEYCHPAPPMAFVEGPSQTPIVVTATPRP